MAKLSKEEVKAKIKAKMKRLAPASQLMLGDTSARLTGWIMTGYHTMIGRWFPPKLRILFSPHEQWQAMLQKMFKRSGYKVSFGPMTPENVRNNDLIMPLDQEALESLAPLSAYLASSLLPPPSPATVALCHDKVASWSLLHSCGFDPNLPAIGADLEPPFFIKPRRGSNPEDCHIIHTLEEAAEATELIKDRDHYCQAAVPGRRLYSANILFREGRIAYMVTVVYHLTDELAVRGQEGAVRFQRLGINRYATVFTDMLRSLGFEGLCSIDYKTTLRGPAKVLEINPFISDGLVRHFPYLLRHLDYDAWPGAHPAFQSSSGRVSGR